MDIAACVVFVDRSGLYPRKLGEPVKSIGDISVEQAWRQIEAVLSFAVDADSSSVTRRKQIIDE